MNGTRKEVFEPNASNPDRRTTILVSPENGGTSWYHTRAACTIRAARPERPRRRCRPADGITLMIEALVEIQARSDHPGRRGRSAPGTPAGGVSRQAGHS